MYECIELKITPHGFSSISLQILSGILHRGLLVWSFQIGTPFYVTTFYATPHIKYMSENLDVLSVSSHGEVVSCHFFFWEFTMLLQLTSRIQLTCKA